MSEDTYSRFLPTLLCDELVQLHIVNALVRDPSCLELFRRFLGSSPGSAELVARYEPRFQLWSLGVAAPAAGGISEAERATRLSAAIEWALEQPPAQLGLAPGTPLLLNAKTALMAHRQAVLASGESTGVFGPFVASSAAAAAPAVSPPLPHTLRGGPPTPPPPPRQTTGIFAEQSGRFDGDGDGCAAVVVCRRTDGGSIYDAAEEDAEMEKAALMARAQGVAEAEMGVATATLIKASPDQKLGIVLVCGGDSNAPLHISKLRPGGLGALCGELQPGDRIVQINGCEARRVHPPPPAPPLSPLRPLAPFTPGALPAPRPAVRRPLTRGPRRPLLPRAAQVAHPIQATLTLT